MVGHLLEHFYEINEGIGVHKSPELYGAFPTDPYSHTPENSGVKQPGMTGQVKEDVLSRFLENGIVVANGCVHICLELFDQKERLQSETEFSFIQLGGGESRLIIPSGGFGFTFCQVPIIYRAGVSDEHTVFYTDGTEESFSGLSLNLLTSQRLFSRSNEIHSIECRCSVFSS